VLPVRSRARRTGSYNNQTIFPQFPRLTADFAGMEGFLYGSFDTLANGVVRLISVDAQPTKLLFHLQDFKLEPGLLFQFREQRLQVCAESPNNLEPAIIVSEAQSHSCVAKIALGIEPRGPLLDQLLLKFLVHMRLLPACRTLSVAHEPRRTNRGFQLMCSRRLKFDGFDDICDPYFPPVLECRLRPQDISFP